jgi:hypothetical protein
VFGFLKRALRMEQRRLSIEELLPLVEAILDYGLTIQAHENWSSLPPPYTIVDISELALRFRRTPQDIKDALLLIRATGRAEPLGCRGHWKMKLTGAHISREAERAA